MNPKMACKWYDICPLKLFYEKNRLDREFLFQKNKQIFGLGPKNAILFDLGGHAIFKQETAVVAEICKWLADRGF